jgi:hypothetical protein
MNKDQDPNNRRISTEKTEFTQMLDASGLPAEVVHEVKSQLKDIDSGESNIVFLYTDGPYVVTGIHVPASALDNKPGPVLMRGGSENSIIAAFSRDFIMESLKKLDVQELLEAESAGLQSQAEDLWVAELEKMSEMVKMELAINPPEKWDDFPMGDR